jgi:NAD-dependent SIR2 family protein deacetylase
MPHGVFVLTSNVDGQFQKAGFDPARMLEIHGSIHHLQCSEPCGGEIWPADEIDVKVDETTFRACPPLPRCERCGAVARPNILMFGDFAWHSRRSTDQRVRFQDWMDTVTSSPLAIVECGAGTAVPSVRAACERFARRAGATLIRINPREPQAPAGALSLATTALEALETIDRHTHQRAPRE